MDIADSQSWTNLDTSSLSVSEAAEMLNVSDKTLRRWDTAGLLKPKRSPTGRRIYTREMLIEFASRGRSEQQSPPMNQEHPLYTRAMELIGELRAILPQVKSRRECMEVVFQLGEMRKEIMETSVNQSSVESSEVPWEQMQDGMDVLTFANSLVERADSMLNEFGDASDRQAISQLIKASIDI